MASPFLASALPWHTQTHQSLNQDESMVPKSSARWGALSCRPAWIAEGQDTLSQIPSRKPVEMRPERSRCSSAVGRSRGSHSATHAVSGAWPPRDCWSQSTTLQPSEAAPVFPGLSGCWT